MLDLDESTHGPHSRLDALCDELGAADFEVGACVAGFSEGGGGEGFGEGAGCGD